jgi:hypothetical protein
VLKTAFPIMDFDNPKREMANIAPGHHQPTRVLNGFQFQNPLKKPGKK